MWHCVSELGTPTAARFDCWFPANKWFFGASDFERHPHVIAGCLKKWIPFQMASGNNWCIWYVLQLAVLRRIGLCTVWASISAKKWTIWRCTSLWRNQQQLLLFYLLPVKRILHHLGCHKTLLLTALNYLQLVSDFPTFSGFHRGTTWSTRVKRPSGRLGNALRKRHAMPSGKSLTFQFSNGESQMLLANTVKIFWVSFMAIFILPEGIHDVC